MVADRLATPHAAPALPVPAGTALDLVHSPLRRTTETAEAIDDAMRQQGWAGVRRPDPGFAEIHQGAWQGLRRDEVESPLRRRALGLAPQPDRQLGARWRVAARRPGTGPAGARRASGAARRGPAAGDARSIPGRRLRRAAARPALVGRGRSRRGLQGRLADPVRPAPRAVLDVVDGPVRDHDRRAPGRAAGPARPQPDRASRARSRPDRRRPTKQWPRRRPRIAAAPERSSPGLATRDVSGGEAGPSGGTPAAAG